MASLQQFSTIMLVRANRFQIAAGKLQRQCAQVTHLALVSRTPVDTGLARSNWLVGIGSSPTQVVPPHSPGRHLGISESANLHAAVAEATKVLSTHIPGADIYIVNNTPYIETLGKGHSPQAAPGWIALAIQSGLEAVRQANLLKTP